MHSGGFLSYSKKRKISQNDHSLSLVVIYCHSLLFVITRCHSLSLVVIRCLSLYHSLSFVVTRCATRCHSLSLVVTRCITRLSSYKRSIFLKFISIHRKTPVLKPLFADQVAILQFCNFIKKRFQHGCFTVNIEKFLKTHILKKICERLLLNNVEPNFSSVYLKRVFL